MILDNQNTELKVHEWIAKYTEDGTMDIVTGYFTIGALNFLSESTNANIDKYRMVLGDLVNFDPKFKTLNLLNENIGIDTALKLATTAKKATAFLGLNKIEIKTVEPNFCHAKLYLKTGKNDDRHNYFISGSSNLTEAGMGSKHTSNVELNIAEHSNNDQHKALALWFNNLWNNDKTYTDKT
ncbi:MAG: phospholipase D-like domain-containing protein, partial [Bacteroidia bacterium]